MSEELTPRELQRKLLREDTLARFLHADHCRETSTYLRTDDAIASAWAADSKNRGVWLDHAKRILKFLDNAA